MPDFEIKDEGSLVLFRAQSDEAKTWWSENVDAGLSFGYWKPVEHRYADAIADGIIQAGLTIEQA